MTSRVAAERTRGPARRVVSFDTATPADVAAVARGMRDVDVMEFLATSTAVDRDALAAELLQRYGGRDDLIVARLGADPVGIGGLIEHRPNVVTLLFFATDAFPAVALALTRFIARRLFPAVRAAGVHRIEALSHGERQDAHRWIGLLGLQHEATLRGYGRGGEAFEVFAWVAEQRATSSGDVLFPQSALTPAEARR